MSSPAVVITRVLSVGLKSQEESAKINSVVRILNHLGATHKIQIKNCIVVLVLNSIDDPLVIPFLLNLSSLSELISSTVINVSVDLINEEMAEKIGNLIPIWYSKDLVKDDSFTKLGKFYSNLNFPAFFTAQEFKLQKLLILS